jgi:hypothetical protein
MFRLLAPPLLGEARWNAGGYSVALRQRDVSVEQRLNGLALGPSIVGSRLHIRKLVSVRSRPRGAFGSSVTLYELVEWT